MAATSELAGWVAGARLDGMPAQALERARAAVVDTVAAILSGAGEEVTRIAAALVREDGGAPLASQLGGDLRCPPEAAALLNGISGHALDYDDVSVSETGHPSVVVLPAALAAAELAGADGRTLLEAYVCGVETTGKLGLAMGHEHYRRGWHATSTLGTLGAAMAAGKALGLRAPELVNALGIAASEASGSRQNFGTMTKPFHAGHAAAAGVRAARLASRGLTAHPAILESELGFFALFSFGAGRPEDVGASLREPLDILAYGLSVKKYPCCFATHRAADAVLDLRAEGSIDPARVRRAVVTVPAGAMAPLLYQRPRTGLAAKFSMEYVVAAALQDGGLKLATFTDEQVRRPDVRALMERVEVREDPGVETRFNPIEEGYVEVEVELRDGRHLKKRVEEARGSPGRPLSDEQLAVKFRDCAAGVLAPEQAEAVLERLLRIDAEPDVSRLAAAMAPLATASR